MTRVSQSRLMEETSGRIVIFTVAAIDVLGKLGEKMSISLSV